MPRDRGRRYRLATGIYRDKSGIAVIVSVAGKRHEQRFPHDTDLTTLLVWRKARLTTPLVADGTLKADAPRYLAAVSAMPSYAARAWQIGQWVRALGRHKRREITPLMIRTQMQAFSAQYAPQTCRHLLNALRQLYTVLDGKGAANPARDVPPPPVPQPEARAIPVLQVAKVLHALRPTSKTRARLAVIATTGMAHCEVARLKPEHVDWQAGTITILGRHKGAGQRPRTIPMTRHSRLALRAFIRANAWGAFSTASMRSRFLDACQRAGADGQRWRPYDLRHTLATALALGGDERAVQAWLGHTTLATSSRYTLGSISPRLTSAKDWLDGRRMAPLMAPRR